MGCENYELFVSCSLERGRSFRMELINVKLKKSRNDSYGIYVGQGAMEHLGLITEAYKDADRYVVISDSIVNPLYGDIVREKLQQATLPVDTVEIPAGEKSKSMATVVEVVRQLIALNASRKSLLVALGGGVVGDLTGFVASIFKRGIPYVQIATSLVAQVDSSVGGKTGVDTNEGKNLIGTFYQPKAVFIDPSFLDTLSERDFKNGLAEIIKYGIIADEDLFELLCENTAGIIQRKPNLMKTLIERSCKIKAEIVEKDEKEGDLRRILNFGHTVGHALEATSDYRLSHGEAVAIGIVAATKISHKLEYLDETLCKNIISLVEQYGLPISIPRDFDTQKILDYMASDKKVVGRHLHFVLIDGIGKPFVTPDVPRNRIREIVDELKSW